MCLRIYKDRTHVPYAYDDLKKSVWGERGLRQRPRMMSRKQLFTEKTEDQERKSWEQGGSTEGAPCTECLFNVSQGLDLSLNTETMRRLFGYVKGLYSLYFYKMHQVILWHQ